MASSSSSTDNPLPVTPPSIPYTALEELLFPSRSPSAGGDIDGYASSTKQAASLALPPSIEDDMSDSDSSSSSTITQLPKRAESLAEIHRTYDVQEIENIPEIREPNEQGQASTAAKMAAARKRMETQGGSSRMGGQSPWYPNSAGRGLQVGPYLPFSAGAFMRPPKTSSLGVENESVTGRAASAEQQQKKQDQGILTQLKIRIAILENELKHSEKAREEAVHSCATIARILGTASGAGKACGDCNSLRRETQLLKQENVVLWKRIERRNSKRIVEFDPNSSSDEFPFGYTSLSSSNPRHSKNGGDNGMLQMPLWEGKGKGKEMQSDPVSTYTIRTAATLETKTPKPKPSSEPAEPGAPSKPNNGFSSSFVSDSPTVPNSPRVAATPSSGFPSPILAPLQPSPPLIEVPNLYPDVGLESLEDVLSGPMDGVSRSFGRPIVNTKEPGPGIDVELEEQMGSLAKIENLPTPGVLKTGFDAQGSFRGAEYDHTLKRSFGRHVTRDYNNKDLPFKGTWSSAEERDAAIENHRQEAVGTMGRPSDGSRIYPDFFRHGIAFKPSETDQNYFRTVVITNLPANICLRDLLHKVRGGEIISAVLMNTTKVLGAPSAMVQFAHQRAAESYAEYAFENPIHFDDSEHTVSVYMIPTASYPVSAKHHRNQRQTRCLAIPDFPEDISLSRLESDLTYGNGYRAGALVEIYLSDRNTLHLEFSSIDAAGSAFGFLQRRVYSGLDVCFESDPCSRSLGEIDWPIPPRPPMLPRLNQGSIDKSGSSLVQQVAVEQRKRLAALENQTVNIPSFSGKDIQASSWADEVNDEVDLPIPEPLPAVTTIIVKAIRDPEAELAQKTLSEHVNKLPISLPPIGLAGSKFASSSSTSTRASTRPTAHPHQHRACDTLAETIADAQGTSDSERSYSIHATRLLRFREQHRGKSPPRVSLEDILASDDEGDEEVLEALEREAEAEEGSLVSDGVVAESLPDSLLVAGVAGTKSDSGEKEGEKKTDGVLATPHPQRYLSNVPLSSPSKSVSPNLAIPPDVTSLDKELGIGAFPEAGRGDDLTPAPGVEFVRGKQHVLAEDPFASPPPSLHLQPNTKDIPAGNPDEIDLAVDGDDEYDDVRSPSPQIGGKGKELQMRIPAKQNYQGRVCLVKNEDLETPVKARGKGVGGKLMADEDEDGEENIGAGASAGAGVEAEITVEAERAGLSG